jgi:hypothetical protein
MEYLCFVLTLLITTYSYSLFHNYSLNLKYNHIKNYRTEGVVHGYVLK